MSQVMREIGWAKVNLALHVRRRRDDGYHELETIFAFVNQGDEIEVEIAKWDHFTVEGEFAPALAGADGNLVLEVLHLLRNLAGSDKVPPLTIRLKKNLPVAAGIGGGSADAAAMGRLIRDQFLKEIGDDQLMRLLSRLGADVAACVESRTQLGRGVGDDLSNINGFDIRGMPILLVNPYEEISTGPIFKAWDQIDRGPLYLGQDMRGDLLAARNDLQRPAIAQCAAIGDILLALGGYKAWLSRMSGSGATCFALFDSAAQRDEAADHMAQRHPNWWKLSGELR